MPPTNFSTWGRVLMDVPVVAGIAIAEAFTGADRQPRANEYEWFPPLDSEYRDEDTEVAEVRNKAHALYTSIPFIYIAVATKRVQQSNRPSANDPWKAAIFHTGLVPRLVVETSTFGTRVQALEVLCVMLDNRSLREYEWYESTSASVSSVEVKLVDEIKRLASIVNLSFKVSEFAVALKRVAQPDRPGASSDWWQAGLWSGCHEGFVEEFSWAGPSNQFSGETREEALRKLKEKLEWQRG